MTYPSEPSSNPVRTTVRLRGERAVAVGSILMIVGLVLVIVGALLPNTNASSKVSSFQRVTLNDGSGTVTFNDAGSYIAYYESRSVTNSTDQQLPEIPVQLTNQATAQELVLNTPYGNRSDGKIKFLHYDHDGHKGLAMWQFHIDQAGTYRVVLGSNRAAASDATVAFGKSIAQGDAASGWTVVIVGWLLLVGGLIALIVGVVKRRRQKQEFLHYDHNGQPPAWPQQGWPQQSWPQQGPQQQNWPQQTAPEQGWPQQGPQQQNWPQQTAPEQPWPQQSPPEQGWPQQNWPQGDR